MKRCLGKKPPEDFGSNWRQEQCKDCIQRMNYWIETSDHHRQALIEAAEYLDGDESEWVKTLAKKLRISAAQG